MRKVWKQAVFFLTFAFVAVGIVLLFFRRSPATLFRKAHRIEIGGPWVAGSCNYFWLSDQSVLLLEQGTPNQRGEPTVRAFNLAVESDKRRELQNLEGVLNKNRVTERVRNWQISPDGRWLLGENDGYGNQSFWYAVAVDGSHVVVRPHQDDSQEYSSSDKQRLIHTVWRPDSQGWVQVVENEADNKVHVYSYALHSTRVIKHIEDFMLYDRSVIGFYCPERLLAVNRYTGDGGAIGYADFSAVPSASPRVLYFQYVPANMNVREAALSPHGNRIGWIFEVKSLPFGIDALRNSNYVHHEQPYLVGLWTSKIDCSDLQKVGTLGISDGPLSDLRWTPDGRHLSVICQNALCTVPVP